MIIHSKNILPDSNSILLKLTVKDIFNINSKTPTRITKHKNEYVYKQLDKVTLIKSNSSHDICFNEYVTIPENTIGVVTPTREAIEKGLFNTSGVYDTGFAGYVGTTLHNRSYQDIIVDFPLCEMIFIKSSSLYHYNGSYSHNTGTYWVNNISNTGDK